MKKQQLMILIFLFIVMIFWRQYNTLDMPTISYFPISEQETFEIAKTKLTLDKSNNSLTWTSISKSTVPLALRQDISLLYADRLFIGIQSKWIENTGQIELQQVIANPRYHMYETISYHHGEIHTPDQSFNIVQHMSADSLAIKEPITNTAYLHHVQQLIQYFELDQDLYLFVPLTQLVKFNTKNIPSLEKDKTEQVIGQLWEGLYKNYVVPIMENKANQKPHYMPIVLFDKQLTHLIVLYEINGENEMLIQHISK